MEISLGSIEISPFFWVAIIVYVFPGVVLLIILREIYRDSIKLFTSRDPIVIFFNSFSLSTIYWLVCSQIVMRGRIDSEALILLISLGIPLILLIVILILNLIRIIQHRWRKLSKSDAQHINIRKRLLNKIRSLTLTKLRRYSLQYIKRVIIFVVAIYIALSFFYWTYYAESIHEVLPAGHDRNAHLARIIWFLETNRILINMFGTNYLNFYPVSMHMVLATIIRITLYIANIFGIQHTSTEAFLANWKMISMLFSELICFFMALYPIAIYTVSKELTNDENLAAVSMIVSLLFLSNVAILEPFHNIIGNYLVGLFTIIMLECVRRDLLADLKHASLLAIFLTSITLIHTFSLVYASIIFILMILTYLAKQIVCYVQGKKFIEIKKLVASIILAPTLSLVFGLAIYPEYIIGILSEMVRRLHTKTVYEHISVYSTTGLPKRPGFLTFEGFLTQTKFALGGTFLVSFILSLLLGLVAVFIYVWGRASLTGTTEIRGSLGRYGGLILLLFASAIYTFTPVLPKMGIEEVRGVYLYSISLGGAILLFYVAIKAWLTDLAKVLLSKKARLKRYIKIMGYLAKVMLIVLIVFGLVSMFEYSHSLAKQKMNQIKPGRIIGYLNINEAYKLADSINSHVPPEYAVVYPGGGGRDMEIYIISLLVNNTVYLAGIYTDMPEQIELAMLYSVCKFWMLNEYKTVRFNINDSYYKEIIDKYNIGAIVETPTFQLDHRRILRLFLSLIHI